MSRRDDPIDDEETQPRRPGLPIDVFRVLRAVRRGKRRLAAAAIAGAIVGAVVAKFVVPHIYQARASLRYEGLPGQVGLDAQRDLPSLVSIAHSEPLMIALRERMHVPGVSVEAMRRLVEVQSDPNSGLVTFTASAYSADGAARMANTVVSLFLEHHRERRRHELETEIAGLDQRIAAANGELQSARRHYDGFRDANHITDLSSEQEQAITEAAHLRSEADLAQAEVRSLEARVQQLEGALARTPRMQAESSGSSDEGRRLRELRARLQEARSSLSERHPEVQALARQVESLERHVRHGGDTSVRMGVSSLHEELQTNLAEAQTGLEGARHRAASLEQLAGQAQERTNRFSSIEGRAATLLAQVNVKQALVNELTEQKAHAADALREIQTGFRALSNAQPPEDAVPSKKRYVIGAAIPIAFVSVVLAMLLYRELRGLRVQTPAEVAWWGNGPVIGTTVWPRDPRGLIDLIADLDDRAPEARGTMLIVGGTETERRLATEIASQLNHDFCASALMDIPVIGALPPPREPMPDEDEEVIDLDLDPLSDERADAPTEMMIAPVFDDDDVEEDDVEPRRDARMAAFAPRPRDIDEPGGRLICTAWTGPSEGQALRRAARLADRVLVVVASDEMRADELARTKARLGRRVGVGFVLVATSDEIARLPDRAGPIEEFWEGRAEK